MKPSVSRLGARYSPAACAAAHSGAVVMCRISLATAARMPWSRHSTGSGRSVDGDPRIPRTTRTSRRAAWSRRGRRRAPRETAGARSSTTGASSVAGRARTTASSTSIETVPTRRAARRGELLDGEVGLEQRRLLEERGRRLAQLGHAAPRDMTDARQRRGPFVDPAGRTEAEGLGNQEGAPTGQLVQAVRTVARAVRRVCARAALRPRAHRAAAASCG